MLKPTGQLRYLKQFLPIFRAEERSSLNTNLGYTKITLQRLWVDEQNPEGSEWRPDEDIPIVYEVTLC